MIKNINDKKIREIKIISCAKSVEIKIDYFPDLWRSGRGKKDFFICEKKNFIIAKNFNFIKGKEKKWDFLKIKLWKNFSIFSQKTFNFFVKSKIKEDDDFLFICINKKNIL